MNNQEIQKLIEDLINNLGLTIKEIIVDNSDEKTNINSTWFRIYLEEPRFFTHRDGESLHALNSLVKRIIENKVKDENFKTSFIIDINNFQKNKIDNLHQLAHMMAERARYFKSNIEIDPMSPFDRRIVHEFLSDATDLKTESSGEGKDRRVVIKYIGSI